MELTADIPRTYYGSMGRLLILKVLIGGGIHTPELFGWPLSFSSYKKTSTSSRTISEVIRKWFFSKTHEKSPLWDSGWPLANQGRKDFRGFGLGQFLALRGEGVLSDELQECPLIAKSFLSEIYSGRKYYS